MVNHKEYYKGEDGEFPQVWSVMSLVSSCMLVVFVYAPKVLQLCTNQLIVWFVQICVNMMHSQFLEGLKCESK